MLSSSEFARSNIIDLISSSFDSNLFISDVCIIISLRVIKNILLLVILINSIILGSYLFKLLLAMHPMQYAAAILFSSHFDFIKVSNVFIKSL